MNILLFLDLIKTTMFLLINQRFYKRQEVCFVNSDKVISILQVLVIISKVSLNYGGNPAYAVSLGRSQYFQPRSRTIFKQFLLMQMNHFIYQNQSVYCDCLAASPHNNPQGLKPSRMQASPFDPNIYHRVTKSTEGKSGEFSRTRTSLRQQKPQTPTPSTQSLLTCVPSHGHLGKIRPLTVDYVAKLPAQPWSANEQPTQSVRPRTNCMPAPGVYYADQPQKRITVIRNTFVNEEGPRFQYRLDEYALKEQNKRAARIKYGAAEGQRFHVGEQLEKRAPMAATLNTERTNRKHSVLFSSSQQHKINLRVSNYSKKSSLRGSAKQQQNPQAPLHQPFKMILKQIESVMDENQNLSEQLSFVIGRGWDDEDKDFKEDRLRTETHATMASNIRNSSMMGSHLFTAQSNVMK